MKYRSCGLIKTASLLTNMAKLGWPKSPPAKQTTSDSRISRVENRATTTGNKVHHKCWPFLAACRICWRTAVAIAVAVAVCRLSSVNWACFRCTCHKCSDFVKCHFCVNMHSSLAKKKIKKKKINRKKKLKLMLAKCLAGAGTGTRGHGGAEAWRSQCRSYQNIFVKFKAQPRETNSTQADHKIWHVGNIKKP